MRNTKYVSLLCSARKFSGHLSKFCATRNGFVTHLQKFPNSSPHGAQCTLMIMKQLSYSFIAKTANSKVQGKKKERARDVLTLNFRCALLCERRRGTMAGVHIFYIKYNETRKDSTRCIMEFCKEYRIFWLFNKKWRCKGISRRVRFISRKQNFMTPRTRITESYSRKFSILDNN